MDNTNKTLEGCLDILGEPILTDDYVIYSMAGHRELFIAKVIGWTKHKMRLDILDRQNRETGRTTLLEHHSTRFVKVQKMMMMRLRMGLDLSEVNENTEINND